MKRRKMDPHLVSMQKHEIAYIASKFSVKPAAVRRVVEKTGRSRKKVYAALRKMRLLALPYWKDR